VDLFDCSDFADWDCADFMDDINKQHGMKKIWFLLVVGFVGCKGGSPESENLSLQPTDFQSKLASTSGAVLLDVRTPAEVQAECIKGEINFDFKSEEFKLLVSGMDKTKPYFVYCAAGVRSGKAAELMRDMDFQKVYTLDGGLKAWKEAGLPTRKSQAIP
jgi:phage shock protein E